MLHAIATSPVSSVGRLDDLAFTFSRELADPEWDDLLQRLPSSHFEQTCAWGAVKNHYGWEVLRLTARASGRMVGGVQVLTRRLGRVGTIGYVSRGPVAEAGLEGLNSVLVDKLAERAKQERWLYLVYDHAYGAHDLAAAMAGQRYHPHPDGIPPSGLMTATLTINLLGSEEELLGQMNRTVRRELRQAAKSGLTFELGGREDLPDFGD